MLKYLKISNFKSYQLAKFRFCNGINVIIGEGLSGKSNIVRAIELVRTYKPINRWKRKKAKSNEPTSIEIKTSENHIIKLVRSGRPEFTFKNLDTGEKKTYRKFNRSIPQKITKELGLSRLNIQKQFDRPYLVFDSPSAVTREINKITNISTIDEWLQKLKESRREKELIQKQNLTAIEEVKSELKKLRKIKKLEPLINRLNYIEKKIIPEINEKIDDIETLIENINKSKKTIKKLSGFLEAEKIIDSLIKSETIKSDLEEEMESIKNYRSCFKKLSQLKDKYLKLIDHLFRILLKEKTCPVCTSEINKKTIERLKREYLKYI